MIFIKLNNFNKLSKRMQSQIDFLSCNDAVYSLYADKPGILSMRNHFAVYIEGRINLAKSARDIQRAIELTWNLTAYQTRNFEQYFINNYKFNFIPINELEVDTQGRIQTKITYFITSGSRQATRDEFSLVPKLDWIQDTFNKYGLPYLILGDENRLGVRAYNKLYSVNFVGYVDPSSEVSIGQIALNSFRKAYPSEGFKNICVLMKESRLGEWGNNVTRLLYYLQDLDDRVVDKYEFKAPADIIINALTSQGYLIYGEDKQSTSIDEYFVAYVAGWQVPDLTKLLTMFSDFKNATDIGGEVVLLEKFMNAKNKEFSEVYFKLNSPQRSARSLYSLNKRSIPSIAGRKLIESFIDQSPLPLSSNNTEAVKDSYLLFKLRLIFFKALPIYKKPIANILKRAWLSKLNQTAFESQNGLRLEVRIYEVTKYFTYGDEETFGFKYTISINGQDPKFLGVTEPTFQDFMRETLAEKEAKIEFCANNAFKIDRVYIEEETIDFKEIQILLDKLWTDSNMPSKKRSVLKLDGSRLKLRSKLEKIFYSRDMKPINRLTISWLVDEAEPNPVYFNRPTQIEILQSLKEANVQVLSGTPFFKKQLDVVLSDEISSLLVINALREAWHTVNSDLEIAYIELFLEKDSIKKEYGNITSRVADENGAAYFVGVRRDSGFDVYDLNEPSKEIVRRALQDKLPNLKFLPGKDQYDKGLKEMSADKNNSSLLLIFGSSVGGLALVIITMILVAFLIRR